jgi:Tol biopolymer transport system component
VRPVSIPIEWDRPIVTAREFPNFLGLSTPAFSPDGVRIAYTVVSAAENLLGLYISPAAGGTPTMISAGTAPSWSPDGASIAYVRWKANGFPLATLRVGSSQPPVEIYANRCVQWSPSGEWIACATQAYTVLVTPDGKAQRMLTPINSAALAWSKDSQTIYSIRTENGQRALVALDVRTDTVRTVAKYGTDLPPLFAPWAWGVQLSRSPDGTNLAIGTTNDQSDLWILDGFAQ